MGEQYDAATELVGVGRALPRVRVVAGRAAGRGRRLATAAHGRGGRRGKAVIFPYYNV